MNASLLLRLPEGLALIAITAAGDGVLLQVEATAERACCPLCHTCSTRIHSRYARTVMDLPCAGRRVRLCVQVRRFRCETPECPRKLFAERLSPFIEPWARMTTRLCQAIQALGLATSGELGARLGERLGIGTKPSTILRRVMALPTPPPASVAALGIDDFALRRGRRYGTILVDLTQHHVIDLLPDQQAETAAAWMKQHAEIELVSRDRGGDYAAAATLAAPQAVQVADRFHIVKNLAEAVELTLAASRAEMLQALQSNQEAPGAPLQANTVVDEWRPQPDATAQAASLAKLAERYERYQQMMALSAQGLTMQEISRRLQISERTIQRWRKQGIFPERKRRRKQHSGLDPYLAFVISRLQSGCQNVAVKRDYLCYSSNKPRTEGGPDCAGDQLAVLSSRRSEPNHPGVH